MTPIFPSLPGLGWSVSKAPRFATRVQRAVSGRELRVLDQPNPIWTWTLTYSMLRDEHDARAAIGTGDGGTTVFQLVRTMGAALPGGGFAEPITAPNTVSTVYFNGVRQSG